VTGSSSYVTGPAPLLGRADVLADLTALAATRPGVIVIAGEEGAGTSRMADELASRLALDGAAVVLADREGPGLASLEAALTAAGHTADPTWAARLRPIVALLGDRADEPGLAQALVRRLDGSRALVVLTGRGIVADAPTVTLERLGREDAAALVRHLAPRLDAASAARIADLGDGLPGRLVPLAHGARRWPGGDAPPPIPEGLAAPALRVLDGLDPWVRDLAGWAAVADEPLVPGALSRLCRLEQGRVERGLDALTRAGLLDETPGPPATRWAFRARAARAAVAAALGGAELRRRHAGALVAGRAAGDPPAALLRHALGAADAEAVVGYGLRAAREARAAGDPQTALADAERVIAWWTPAAGESRRLAALHERGMALLDLSSWHDAIAPLEEAARGRRDLGERDAALSSASAASAARWALGRHDAALRGLQDHLAHSRDPGGPVSAERAEALTQAAGMAVMTSRFGEAMGLAEEARAEAAAAGADEVSTRALIFLGMAESGRGGPGGLLHLARARREGERAEGTGRRNATLAMIYESHVLLAVGRPDDAAARARAGGAAAAAAGVVEHEIVLAGNLGEALAGAGELVAARAELERAAAGWRALGRDSHAPAAPGIAWLLFAEGRIEEALVHYRELAADHGDAPLFEQIATLAAGHALSAAAAGADAEAARVATTALDAWAATDDRLTSVLLLAAGAEVLRGSEAARCAEALAEMAPGSPLAGAAQAYAEGMLARPAAPAAAAARLRAAAGAFEALGMRWWATRALFSAGVADGRSDQAGADLLRARGEFGAMGADGWRGRGEESL
jgi:tetratricopeptide (TPR) repeat protein